MDKIPILDLLDVDVGTFIIGLTKYAAAPRYRLFILFLLGLFTGREKPWKGREMHDATESLRTFRRNKMHITKRAP